MVKNDTSSGLNQHLLAENIKRLKIIGVAGSLINVIIISTSIIREGILYCSTWECIYRVLWVLASIAYIVGVGSCKNENALGLRQKLFFYGAATLSLMFSAIITAVAATAQGFTYLYIINTLLTASFLILPHVVIVAVMIPSTSILIHAALTTPEGILTQYGTMINIMAVSIFAIVIAHTNYRMWCSRYEDRQIIELQNKELHLLSSVDGLTGIPNRRHIDYQLDLGWKQAIETQKSYAILMIDIDHFKRYNDFYGHIKGDHCLIKVAASLKHLFSNENYHVGRYGGEEFLVLLPSISYDEAQIMAERTRQVISNLKEPHEMSSFEHVTVSIGGSYFDTLNCVNKIKMIDWADRALYRAKLNGRNQISFHNEVIETV